jgi:hypothetical protein
MNLTFTRARSQLLIAALFTALSIFFSKSSEAQYTSIYNGESYSSTMPYNLNVIYFVPNDVPLDPTYKKRLSALILYARNFERQGMIMSGYGDKTFGLFTETANPDSVKIILINGLHPTSAYPYHNTAPLEAEVNAYFANNPVQKTSDHTLILTAVTNPDSAHVPFVGADLNCFAIDYPQMDLQYFGQTGYWGDRFTKWFGGMMHELGHGLNVGHSHETASEHFDAIMGTNIMGIGNRTIGFSPTFINRAGCAVLNNVQVFATTPGGTYYNGHHAAITSLNTHYSNGNIIASGTYTSNREVTAINFYQDPIKPYKPGTGYYRVAWSVYPAGTDSFYVSMPVSEITGMDGIYGSHFNPYHLDDTTRTYHLIVELVLKNGEKDEIEDLAFTYKNGIPKFDNPPLSISDIALQNSVQFFPNPVKDELNISVSGGQKMSSLAVFDLYGRRILIQNKPLATLDMKPLPPGVYIVEVQLKSGAAVRKKVSKM